MSPLFIALDGPDGAGTSTHARMLCESLKKEGHDVLLTAEPTNGPIGTFIRDQLKTGSGLTPLSLQLLFMIDRLWHLETVIEPALAEGKIVITDRYAPSTLVYAKAQGIDLETLKMLNDRCRRPDLTIFTLPPVSVSVQRLQKRKHKDLFETTEMQTKIHAAYTEMAHTDASIKVIDTSHAPGVAAKEIAALVQAKL